ncbi:hypothetical protein MKW94_008489, partial [Papaver nudicaule]|nr:hypothetical protein [Papaver nudicaule]
MALQVLSKLQCFVLLLWMCLASAEVSIAGSREISKPDCKNHCGNVSIPYPFGIGAGCFLDEWFEISCEESPTRPEPYRHGFTRPVYMTGLTNYSVSNISILDGDMTAEIPIARNCPDMEFDGTSDAFLGKFTFSSTKNRFIGMGCNTWAAFLGLESQDDNVSGTGCVAVCEREEDDVTDGSCSGVGCCQTSIPDGLQALVWKVGRIFPKNLSSNYTDYNHNSNSCSYGLLIETSSFQYSSIYLKDFKKVSAPVVKLKRTGLSYACGPNTDCIEPAGNKTRGYRCNCRSGYRGNPYLSTAGSCE